MHCISFSPDGKYIASGDWDYEIKLWEAQTGKIVRTLKGHTGLIWQVSFSPNGNLIASAGGNGDGSIKIWEMNTGKNVRTLEVDPDGVYCVDFSPDSKYIATGRSESKFLF
ncbi:MAG: PD40 domain-containing protein [Ignavibacteria bacterium]|nr:PD40 domain-containing protein [Ignavibacteria bacterium]